MVGQGTRRPAGRSEEGKAGGAPLRRGGRSPGLLGGIPVRAPWSVAAPARQGCRFLSGASENVGPGATEKSPAPDGEAGPGQDFQQGRTKRIDQPEPVGRGPLTALETETFAELLVLVLTYLFAPPFDHTSHPLGRLLSQSLSAGPNGSLLAKRLVCYSPCPRENKPNHALTCRGRR